MEEKIKNIISLYTGIASESIMANTVIDRTAVSSSILLHRMYADLNKEGFAAKDYFSIKNYGQLLASLNNGTDISPQINSRPQDVMTQDATAAGYNIGIDVEEISRLPQANDYREDEFYTMNFSSSEIAYCILQPDPRASFAGLFAVKEAIIKADNNYQHKSFSAIIIDHLPTGKPVYASFEISISHTASLAIAVAVRLNTSSASNLSIQTDISKNPRSQSSLIFLTAVAALILSIIALLIILF